MRALRNVILWDRRIGVPVGMTGSECYRQTGEPSAARWTYTILVLIFLLWLFNMNRNTKYCQDRSVRETKQKSNRCSGWCDLWVSLTAACQQLSAHWGSAYLSVGLFVRCLNLLPLIVAAGRQKHEDSIFVCTCIKGQISIKYHVVWASHKHLPAHINT